MNGTKNGVMKAALINFTLTLVAAVIGGIIVEKFVRKTDSAVLASKSTTESARQVTVSAPTEQATVST